MNKPVGFEQDSIIDTDTHPTIVLLSISYLNTSSWDFLVTESPFYNKWILRTLLIEKF
jgi:hypothetical protein